MHYDNGLWDDVRNTPANHTVWDLDGRMEAEIGHVAHSWDFWHQKNGEFNDPQFILCGSGVSHFDSRHIKYHFPRFWQCLKGYDHETKPTIDVGVVRRFTNAFIPPVGERFTKPAESIKHRAMDDVNQIIQEAERMKTVLSDMFTAYDDVQATYEHGKSYYAGKEIEHNPDGML
jgi:oligoribonuclease (3'-5' exoribonuclease)